MDWSILFVICIGSLLVLLGLGAPVAIAFMAVDIVGILWLKGFNGLSLITSSFYDSVGSLTLGAIPLFYFLGEILFESQTVNIILDAVDKWIGRVRARLNLVAIGVGTVLGALSGSFMADSAILGSTLLPEMTKRGYDRKLGAGTIMCAGSLAAIIPPSVLAVLTGSLAEVSISKLLIAGVMPGILLAILFVTYILLRVKLNPGLAPEYECVDVSLGEKVIAILRVLPFLLIILMVLGLILLGIATPTESAGTGAIGAIIVVTLYGKMNFKVLKTSLLKTLRLTAMIFFIVVGSKAFSQLLALSGATRGLLETINHIDADPIIMFAIMQLIPFLLGCFLDQMSIIVLAVPIYTPVIAAMHFDPVWFWLVFLLNLTVGAITPPFGLVLFVLKGTVPNLDMMDIYKAAIPFVCLIVLGMLLIVACPPIATWLPNLIK